MIIIVPVLLAGLLWWWFARTVSNIRTYEKNLIEIHQQNPKSFIESQLRSYDPLLLAKLCAYDKRKERLIEGRLPRMEKRKIGFTRMRHYSVLAEIVRCDRRKAIMQAPGKNCAYVLQRRRGVRTEFRIRQKFCFRELEAVNEPYTSVPTVVDDQYLVPDVEKTLP